jgi:Glycosyl hydrolase family 10
MGTMILDLPTPLPKDVQTALERACVAGSQDGMPSPTHVLIDDGKLFLSRNLDESGCVTVPWTVPGRGQVMISTGTLMEKLQPYQFAIELARGKTNQLRRQAMDWPMAGLQMSDALAKKIQDCTRQFSKAVTLVPDPGATQQALSTLALVFETADDLAQEYANLLFQFRHKRQPRLDTIFACRLTPGVLEPEQEARYLESFNAVSLPIPWGEVEADQGNPNWLPFDNLVAWASNLGVPVIGGPLVDFSGRGLPHWLWEKQADLSTMADFLADFVMKTVKRYQGVIRAWQITAASNWAGVIALADEELMWLTVRLADVVRRISSNLEIIIGLAQPWGDYLVRHERSQSPFVFADNLLRTGLKLAALDLEVIMGVGPRGSYCRDLLDTSRMLDLYAHLGVPLQVTLGYPSAAATDTLADPDQEMTAGSWRAGFSPEVQAEWADSFARLCVCKSYVRAVHWAHFTDARPHIFPHCGLLDAQGNAKPALKNLATLRSEHLI